jgi:hypothetical protein
VNRADYRQPLTGEEFARLKQIFPQGVCDYSRPGVGQIHKPEPWLRY